MTPSSFMSAPSCSMRDSRHCMSQPTAFWVLGWVVLCWVIHDRRIRSFGLAQTSVWRKPKNPFLRPDADRRAPSYGVVQTEGSSSFGLAQTSVWRKPKSPFSSGCRSPLRLPFHAATRGGRHSLAAPTAPSSPPPTIDRTDRSTIPTKRDPDNRQTNVLLYSVTVCGYSPDDRW